MTNKNPIYKILFGISLVAFLLNTDMKIWMVMICLYLAILIITIKDKFQYKFPFGEFICLVFFIENTFSLSLLYFLKGNQLHVGDFQYSQIDVTEYLPFSFLCSQSLFLGYMNVKEIPGKPWLNFVKNFDKLINRNNLRMLLIIGSFGIFLQVFKLSPFIALIISNFFNCGLIAFALYTKKPFNIYILTGLAISIFSASRSGMFGNLTYFIAYYIMLYILIVSSTGKKINWVKAIFFGIAGFYLLALIHNVKTDYRTKIWAGRQQGTSESFYNTVNTNFDSKSPVNIDFYMPLILRLNQGYLVTAVMKKVPLQEPFADGATILKSAIDAFVPRILDEDKEEAGGRQKIKRFTNITLVGFTSMNLGLLGETYANFGKSGSIIFIFIYGFLIALFNKKILIFSYRYPIILVFFPIFFQFLVGTGSDFLWVFNGVVKSSILIFAMIILFNWQKKQQILGLGDKNLLRQ